MNSIDLIIRTMAGTQLLFLMLLLARSTLKIPTLRFAAILPLGLAAFMATSAPGANLGSLTVPLTLLCVVNPVWFWIFSQALFDDGFRFEPRHYIALIAMMALGGWHELVLPSPPSGPANWLFHGAVLTFVALAVTCVLDGKRGDLVESRRRSRTWFVAGIAAYGIAATALLLAFGGELPLEVRRLNILLIFGVAVAASLFVATRTPDGTTTAPRGNPFTQSRPRGVDPVLVQRIRESMEVDRLYRQETLTVATLAQAIGSQEYLVRRAINGGLGYKNFNEFLHHYRLTEASARLESQPHLPILSIALDVGYGSIGPFNRAFRLKFNKTPSEYRSQRTASAAVVA